MRPNGHTLERWSATKYVVMGVKRTDTQNLYLQVNYKQPGLALQH